MKAKVKATGEIVNVESNCDYSNGTFWYQPIDIDDDRSWEPHELEIFPDTRKEVTIEGWATKDSPEDDVLVHLNEPHKWKIQPVDKDEYWVSSGKKYNFADSLFPDLTPEKPQKVRITITPTEE